MSLSSIKNNIFTNISNWFTDGITINDTNISLKKTLGAIAAIIVLKKTTDLIYKERRHGNLMEKARQKRQERDRKIVEEFTPMVEIPEEVSHLVLNATVTELIQLLNDDKITSEQALRVYHNRAINIGLRLELIGESNFAEALILAKKCDETRRNTPREERGKLGNLFGVPISIKESIEIKGMDTTTGLAKFLYKPSLDDGPCVKLLRAQGAIPFIKANTGQSLVIVETANHIWGRAQNPWDQDRSTGGSSGGDAGLVAAKCAPIGYGSDFYGSIRVPSGSCGVYGFKPTCGRYTHKGEPRMAYHDFFRYSMVRAMTGPIGRCVDDLVLLTKGMITPQNREFDPSDPLVPWNEEKYQSKEKLKIGYFVTEDLFGASRSCKRAVREAVAALEKQGHKVIEIKFPNFTDIAMHLLTVAFLEGKARRHLAALEGEKPVHELEALIAAGRLPDFLKSFMKLFVGKRVGMILDCTKLLSANEAVLKTSRYLELKQQFLKYWVDYNLDAVVCPTFGVPAFKHNYSAKLMPSACYLWPASFANLPSGVVPVTKVLPGEDVYNSEDSLFTDDVIYKYAQENMKGSVGLPISVQVLALPWEDEKCLTVMKTLENEFNFHEFPVIN